MHAVVGHYPAAQSGTEWADICGCFSHGHGLSDAGCDGMTTTEFSIGQTVRVTHQGNPFTFPVGTIGVVIAKESVDRYTVENETGDEYWFYASTQLEAVRDTVFHAGRDIKVANLRQADYKTGRDKLSTARHSRRRLNQIKRREARYLGQRL